MINNIFDVIIVGGGASGLFCSIFMPKHLKKIIIEKNNILGKKVLLSGGERCNISNINIEPEFDYFGSNTKVMYNILSAFSNYDLINRLNENKIFTKIEDNGRIVLESEKPKQLLELLTEKSINNNTEIYTNCNITDIDLIDNIFTLYGEKGNFKSKNVIISTGGKSFFHVGTTGFGYNVARKFGVGVVEPYRGLCGINTIDDLSNLSGNTINLIFQIFDKNKLIYGQNGSLLFTHFGVSGPTVFNGCLKIGEQLRKNGVMSDQEDLYITNNIKIKLIFDLKNTTNKIIKNFKLDENNNYIFLKINKIKDWNEAKVTGGGVKLNQLDQKFQSRAIAGLYFIGEVLDLTGKTGGYNLQLAWSSGYICGKSFK